MKFIVITRVPDAMAGEAGNLATALGSLFVRVEEPSQSNDWTGKVASVGMEALSLLVPVFDLGEIVVADEGGRELVGRLRKPSKWDVGTETFDSIEEAVARSQRSQSDPNDVAEDERELGQWDIDHPNG